MTIERQTVHVSDDSGRIAMLEKRTYGSAGDDNGTDAELKRYIYSNHLQSASLELDEAGDIISYEEYHPYGTTSYQATNTSINAVAKRYRYTGKERDEESGLYYHGARYYIPWLARWVSPDPINSENYNIGKGYGLEKNKERDFLELAASSYEYCYDNPVRFNDPLGEQVPQHDTKQKVIAYTNPEIKKYEANINKGQKDYNATMNKYIAYYKSIGKLNDKSTPADIQKVLSDSNKKELGRIQATITTNTSLLKEAIAIQNQWNKLDRIIEDVVFEYNNRLGLKGNKRLDPNLVKATMFSETGMGTDKNYKALMAWMPSAHPDALYQLNLGRVTDVHLYVQLMKDFDIPVDWKTNYKDMGNANDVRLTAAALITKYNYALSIGNKNKNFKPGLPWYNAVLAFKGASSQGVVHANEVWKLYTTGMHPTTPNFRIFNKK